MMKHKGNVETILLSENDSFGWLTIRAYCTVSGVGYIRISSEILEYLEDGKVVRKRLKGTIRHFGTKQPNGNLRLHRLTGPALIRADESHGWWVNGVDITDDVAKMVEDNGYPVSHTEWDDQAWVMFRLLFSGRRAAA